MRKRIMVLVPLVVWGLACAHGAPPQERFTEVAVLVVEGEECVTLEPDSAEIWRPDVPGRAHQVRWTVRGADSYRVEFEHHADKGGDDFFGKRVLPCRAPERAVTSGLPQRLPPGDGVDEVWDYKVTLYSCEPGAADEICTHDPEILIRDHP